MRIPIQLRLFDFLRPAKKKRSTTKPLRPRTRSRPTRTHKIKISDPHLMQVWISLRETWFPERSDIDRYQVVWSTRNQKRTLASCSLERKRISVARELNYPSHSEWLEPLLYHEMCHAILGYDVAENRSGKEWHGAEFKALEARHPGTNKLDHWIKSGGWTTAVRSDRSKRAHLKRKAE